jgi:hypothetical protein
MNEAQYAGHAQARFSRCRLSGSNERGFTLTTNADDRSWIEHPVYGNGDDFGLPSMR